MISYPSKSAQAQAYLKRPFNQIDIFVEDKSNKAMWLFFLRNHLPDGIKLEDVTALGGRNEVLREARKSKNINRPQLFIIDADLDFVLNRRAPRSRNVYRIGAYCLENIILAERPILDVAQELMPGKSMTQIHGHLNIGQKIRDTYNNFIPLFLLYAAAIKLKTTNRTISSSVYSMCSHTQGNLLPDKIKVARHMRALARVVIREKGFSNFIRELLIIKKKAKKLKPQQIVSGKDYIFPIICEHLRRRAELRHQPEQFKAALARQPSVDHDAKLSKLLAALV